MTEDEITLTESVSAKDHVQGPLNAPVTLVEYGDYECPACGEADAILKVVIERMGNNLCFVYRNFPLSKLHPHAFAAAVAAEAAGAQRKFWEMHDLLYENQQQLDAESLNAYAEKLHIDVERFIEDVESETYAKRVKQDFKAGMMSGVNKTPSLFINGERYDGEISVESLLATLQNVMDEAA